MARYFFDTKSGSDFDQDEVGLEYSNSAEAASAAVVYLGELARLNLVGLRSDAEFSVAVRDESNRIVFTAALNLRQQMNDDTIPRR